jgi:hypothetical protein
LSPTAPGAAVDWGLLQPARIAAAARATIERVVFMGRTPKFKRSRKRGHLWTISPVT